MMITDQIKTTLYLNKVEEWPVYRLTPDIQFADTIIEVPVSVLVEYHRAAYNWRNIQEKLRQYVEVQHELGS